MDKKKGKVAFRWGRFRAPGGWCAVAWTPKGLSGLVLPHSTPSAAQRDLQGYLSHWFRGDWSKVPAQVPSGIQRQTRLALQGKPFRFSAFDISFMTPFQQGILKATWGIGRGQTRSYGWVARKAGSPRGFRAAGQALNRNPIPLFIPCHRVVAGGNRLGGYGGGIDWKIRLLEREGVRVHKGSKGDYWVERELLKNS
jgi:methylated-DNA-[protein]-cysteine S-methyltransferase